MAGICTVTLLIGLFWTLIGAWLVLPFSGLEAALVAFVFYRVCRSTYQRQVICCSAEQVTVQFGASFPTRSWQLERSRTRVRVGAPPHPLAPLQLVIADSSYSIELGHFLNKGDKELALHSLRQTGLMVRQAGESGHTLV